jgi:hypothetical protein
MRQGSILQIAPQYENLREFCILYCLFTAALIQGLHAMSMFLLRYVQPLPPSLFELLTVQLNAQDYVQFRTVRNHHDVVFIIAKSPQPGCHLVAQCLELFVVVGYQVLPKLA